MQIDVEFKIYSPQTCVFLPDKVNSFLSSRNETRKSIEVSSRGVYYENTTCKYVAQINEFLTSKRKKIGRFKTEEEASLAYQKARAEQAEKAKQYLRDLNYLDEKIIQLVK